MTEEQQYEALTRQALEARRHLLSAFLSVTLRELLK